MKLIIGLGNPEPEYANTRHNAGFLAISELAKRHGLVFQHKRALEAEMTDGDMNGIRVILLKPQTYMNVSGRSVRAAMKKFNLTPADLLVVYDDAEIALGTLRFREGGSSGGHNGMQSILDLFPTGTQVARLRMGIGRPSRTEMALEDWVLGKWNTEEKKILPELLDGAVKSIESWISGE